MSQLTPELRARPISTQIVNEALLAGVHPVLAQVLGGRLSRDAGKISAFLKPKLAKLSQAHLLKDIDKASIRVARAICQGEIIGLETDHDCDGQTSQAVLYYNLTQRFGLPAQNLITFIGHRLNEGYGLSQALVQRILQSEPRPTLIITADNGSCDEPRIQQLKACGIDVIVTDHHELPAEGPPQSAYACLNPTRKDCVYPDPYIAGCMVAWLLMAATRNELIKQHRLPANTSSLADSLDFVAVGTVADCVSMMKSANNRAVVDYGLKLINQGLRPCWRACKAMATEAITSEDLGFRIGPLLNSDGRLQGALGSVSFLLSTTDLEANQWIEHLKVQNATRRQIQNKVVASGLLIAEQLYQQGYWSLCIYLPEGHPGVHGIAASRLKEAYGRPTVFLSPKLGAPGLLTGSVRGLEAFHVSKALQWVADLHPELLLSFGGHKGAGGLSLQEKDVVIFAQAFEQATRAQLGSKDQLGPVIWTDGRLSSDNLTLELVELLAQLEPYGREFDAPIFEIEAHLDSLREVGDGTHAKITLTYEQQRLSGIWFNYRTLSSESRLFPLGRVRVAFRVKSNHYQGTRKLDLQVVHLASLENAQFNAGNEAASLELYQGEGQN